MQDEKPLESTRSDLLDRLKGLEGPQASGSLAELAYRRAREALEKALEEARTIRLQAIEDARANRERELTALMESLRALRESAQTQIDSLLREAEIHAERTREQAQVESRTILERANQEAESLRVEANTLRAAADERAREVAAMEADFDKVLGTIGKRLGMRKPKRGLFRR